MSEEKVTLEEANTKCDEHLMLCSQVTDLRTDVRQIKYISWTTLIGFASAAFWYLIKLNEGTIHAKVDMMLYCITKYLVMAVQAMCK